ncbi:MAG TPA: flagellar hook assembly protein FlgD [Gallionellaceae bacterium]|nr:flagellar hook assembly protein FlgD [Gallionellaceae bacterium]
MVAPVQNSTAAATQASTMTSQAADTQDRFLKLLVTQMKNQDPLNPLDNAQVTSQMAQLSTVTGIDKLNATVQALSDSMTAAQSLQAASMIGHAALVPGKQINVVDGKSDAALELTQPADKVTVTITDAEGNVVRTLQLGAQDTGTIGFQWDGKNDAGDAVANGAYKFSASAELSGKKSTPTTLSYGLVESVSLTSFGPLLNMGSLGDVGLDAVRQIL